MIYPVENRAEAGTCVPARTVAVGAIHIGLLWIMLQAAPSLQTSRNVVYQILSPITRLRELVPSAPAVVQRAIQGGARPHCYCQHDSGEEADRTAA